MFDQFSTQKNSYREIGFGIAVTLVLALAIFGPLISLSLGLFVNGYDTLPFIGWVDIRDKPQYRWVLNLATLAFEACLFFSLSQLVYIIPIFFVARAKGSHGFAQGLLIGAALIFLLQSTCVGLMYVFA